MTPIAKADMESEVFITDPQAIAKKIYSYYHSLTLLEIIQDELGVVIQHINAKHYDQAKVQVNHVIGLLEKFDIKEKAPDSQIPRP